MLVEFLAHLVITSALLLIVSRIVPGLQIDGWGSAFIGALVLGLVNSFLRPLMVILTLPFTIVTFGLFLLIINGLMLWLVAALVPGIHLRSFGSAILGSVLLSLLNLAIGAITRPSGPGI
jgi:putative membrane protein